VAKKTKNNVVFDPKKFLSAGAKGSSVVNALDGAVIYISNLVSGNVVDWQTFKKHKTYYEEKKS